MKRVSKMKLGGLAAALALLGSQSVALAMSSASDAELGSIKGMYAQVKKCCKFGGGSQCMYAGPPMEGCGVGGISCAVGNQCFKVMDGPSDDDVCCNLDDKDAACGISSNGICIKYHPGLCSEWVANAMVNCACDATLVSASNVNGIGRKYCGGWSSCPWYWWFSSYCP
jgi:hypothetical protein